MNPREEEFPSKKEAIDPNNNKSKFPKVTSSRQWSNYKNPRIVRVSRAFGGKDRHSKVCTVRGLRDRRIRLSVPTAIQLYDLQERLGLNQPSKVVDWLLDATKHEIDKLPPLPMKMIPENRTKRREVLDEALLGFLLEASLIIECHTGMDVRASKSEKRSKQETGSCSDGGIEVVRRRLSVAAGGQREKRDTLERVGHGRSSIQELEEDEAGGAVG
ncbi:hypothetical protein BUALT_Bualt02G0159700 [Buddleja alternifolia]|uniref:TCP domain-containing protein n=1 Tax=Buddleja alternifolia TaxID=168488 RepID=A0AAV6Y1C8_9LAMI|nr:hypothetical protein BUALT_Bualt02G0159700 [Buddleja alternifolia]